MKRACIILVAMMVAVLGGAGESDSVAMDIEQLVLAGNKYLKGPGANSSTAKKEDFRKEILDSLKDKKVSFAATVKDVVRQNGLGGSFLMTLTDTSQKAIIDARASTSDEKAIDLKVGERVSITGLISIINFASSPGRDGRLFIDVVTIESELTVIGVEPAPVAKASPVTDPTPVVKTTPFAKPASVASVCGKCRGSGKCTWPECRGGRVFTHQRGYRRGSTVCRECNGTGKCLRCGGTGWEREKEK